MNATPLLQGSKSLIDRPILDVFRQKDKLFLFLFHLVKANSLSC